MSSQGNNPDFIEVIYAYYGENHTIKILSMRKFYGQRIFPKPYRKVQFFRQQLGVWVSITERSHSFFGLLTFHHGGRIAQLIEATGCQLVYLPPYSPDLNRIEKCWATLKTMVRKLLP